MREDIKREWFDRLRSGKYHQGIGYLRQEKGLAVTHCCLGILCEMALEAGVTVIAYQKFDDEKGRSTTAYGFPDYEPFLAFPTLKDLGTLPTTANDAAPAVDACYLPRSVAVWAELTYTEQHKLANMNDHLIPFDTIADYIKNHM